MVKNRTLTPLIVAVALGAVVLTGCSKSSDSSAPDTTAGSTTAPSSTTTKAETTSTTAAKGSTTTAAPDTTTTPSKVTPCTTGATTPPAGAVTKSIIDVDGDGKTDTGWIADVNGTVTVGINTAAGGGATAPFQSASPVQRSMLVIDAQEDGQAQVLLDDGRLVQLDAFVGCKIVPMTNPQGQHYTFGLGFTDVGTGVGCPESDAGRHLAGLNAPAEHPANSVPYSVTIVKVNGTKASNGTVTKGTYTPPGDDAAISLLSEVTCGDQTIAADGVSLEN